MPFTATWMDLVVILLSEISQAKRNITRNGLEAEYKKEVV